MSRSRASLIATLVLAALISVAAVFVVNQRLMADRSNRESSFIAIHFIAADAATEDGDAPENLESLLKHFGGKESVLLKPFPDGLVYQAGGGSFTLEEPRARRITLLKKDRLTGSDRKWPRWESSREYARKYPQQQVPVSGFE
jgi:hypothetical protein